MKTFLLTLAFAVIAGVVAISVFGSSAPVVAGGFSGTGG